MNFREVTIEGGGHFPTDIWLQSILEDNFTTGEIVCKKIPKNKAINFKALVLINLFSCLFQQGWNLPMHSHQEFYKGLSWGSFL